MFFELISIWDYVGLQNEIFMNELQEDHIEVCKFLPESMAWKKAKWHEENLDGKLMDHFLMKWWHV